ncbi:5538_t:CDS:2 [Funneliformis geosporum]|uniref:14413_t:CDS:1 n=1 Tax=Funneliformis geosporum TaxID=1117311 RepID=A0A9W4SGZ1_9GLOM|nr:5538_t:CDS:2 [Funneliformis geosporum]CAI2167967.1 14413_t:CDS:2 [Funneliformis geosporum]
MDSTTKNFRTSEEEDCLTHLNNNNVITTISNDNDKRNEQHRLDVDEENDDVNSELLIDEQHKGLDIIISKIGMGRFQRRLLILCGFGWFSDALWILCVAIILPRVQVHFQVPNSIIGLLSSSQYFGMMIGALFWGLFSDIYGRKQAFSWTLGVAVFFGFCASLSQSFAQLCFMFGMLGFGVGGNLPVDGAIFLEFVPKENQYLLTYSSVFFEIGAAFTSFIGYLILPSHSCLGNEDQIAICDVSKENNGWRYVIVILGTCILVMLILRILFFRLLESPKYLISHNRHQEAILVFQEIARINGNELDIDFLDDIKICKSSHKQLQFKQRLISQFKDIEHLFSKKWLSTTLLLWSSWGLISFGSVMFFLYLPKYLEGLEEQKLGDNDESEIIRNGLKNFIIYSIWGIPGAIISSYLIETSLGRKGTMILGAIGTSLSICLFANFHDTSDVILFSMFIGLLKSIDWAVIYCYTPEVFDTKVRGTACGISSVFARITGMVAPIVTGNLISIGASAPLYVTSLVFGLLAAFIFMLPIETRGRQA